jgi:uncharacterized heparinase superfamily protein|tara:strand:- start:542 stop:2197 length:1656 start_codon:yes stop_codon:yes gene_type:complete
MFNFKTVFFYLLAVKINFILFLKKIYFTTNYYNKSLRTRVPEQLYFFPNSFLLSSFVNKKNFTFKISKVNVETFWTKHENNKEEEDLNSFFWLNLINRKNDSSIIQEIIYIWIKNNKKYNKKNWQSLNISKRILAWILNADIILKNTNQTFKEDFFNSIITQVNHLKNNLNNENNLVNKIEIVSAIILSGLVFKEYNKNFEIGIRELKSIVKNFFDDDGCPINRNIYDLVQCSKYLILIKECCKDAQEYIPDYLDDVVGKLIICLYSIQTPTHTNPLFNGAGEFKMDFYLEYLSGLEYKTDKIKKIIGQIYIFKNKRSFLSFDVGPPPKKKNSSSYQSGPLSFEYFIDNRKIITNCGFGNKISKKAELISRLTSAQSTLCLNDSSVTKFERNNLINKTFGASITSTFKTFDFNIDENSTSLSVTAKHDAYKNNFNYLHQRTIRINKKNGNLIGEDSLTTEYNVTKSANVYSIRFHLCPGINAVQTIGKNSILIQIERNKSLIFTANKENIFLEKSIFLGRNQIVNNLCITISGTLTNNENKKIFWEFKKDN